MKPTALVIVTMMAGCAPTPPSSPVQVQSASAETASFTPFRTFGFRLAEVPPAPYQVSARSFEVERLAHDMVASELVRKGYTDGGADADFLVFTSEEAREAGRKGGEAVSRDSQHMREIGRLGGKARRRTPGEAPSDDRG